jgi:hypothetical protein
MKPRVLATLFAAALVFAACGNDENSDSSPRPADGNDTEANADGAADQAATDDHGMDHSDGAMDHSDGAMDHSDGAMDHGDSQADIDSGFAELKNGHHAAIEVEPLDAATQAELDAQLAITREVAELYPTVADAKAAGYRRAGPFAPGLGVHMVYYGSGAALNPDGVMDEADLRTPLSIIYDGHTDEAEIVGFMYYSMSKDEPAGFAGDNDTWHYHTNTCIVPAADGGIDAPFGADTEVEPGLCEKAGGTMLQQTQWMVHVWTVPGYEMADADGGVFGEANRALSCSDGTYHILPQEDWIEYPFNVCKSNPA